MLASFILQVGSLSGKNTLTLNMTAITHYGVDGGADLRKGQCPAGKICSECLEKDIPERKIHIPGDIYVIGRHNNIQLRLVIIITLQLCEINCHLCRFQKN